MICRDPGEQVWLRIEALSPLPIAVPGVGRLAVDSDLHHDQYGLPIWPGRRIQGMLGETWAALAEHFPGLRDAAIGVVGTPKAGENCRVQVLSAGVANSVRRHVEWAVSRNDAPLSPREVLEAVSVVRTYTARDRTRGGAPQVETLRSVRCLRRGWVLYAPLVIPIAVNTGAHGAVLARIALGTRHVGLGRNRGAGHVRIEVVRGTSDPEDAPRITQELFQVMEAR